MVFFFKNPLVLAKTSCQSFTVMWYFSVKSATAAAGNLEHVMPGGHVVLLWLENCQYHNSVKLMQKNFLYAITCLFGPVELAVGKQLIWD